MPCSKGGTNRFRGNGGGVGIPPVANLTKEAAAMLNSFATVYVAALLELLCGGSVGVASQGGLLQYS